MGTPLFTHAHGTVGLTAGPVMSKRKLKIDMPWTGSLHRETGGKQASSWVADFGSHLAEVRRQARVVWEL